MTIWQSQKSLFHFGFSLCELGLAGAWRLVTSIDIKRDWLETLYSKDLPAGDLLCTIQIIWQLLFSEFQVMTQSFWRISNVVVADFFICFYQHFSYFVKVLWLLHSKSIWQLKVSYGWAEFLTIIKNLLFLLLKLSMLYDSQIDKEHQIF